MATAIYIIGSITFLIGIAITSLFATGNLTIKEIIHKKSYQLLTPMGHVQLDILTNTQSKTPPLLPSPPTIHPAYYPNSYC